LKILWRLFFGLLLLAPLVLVLLLLTETGSRSVMTALPRFVPVQIDYDSGSLWRELKLKQISYQDETLSLKISGLTLDMAFGCLWRSAVCFEQLDAERLSLTLLETPKDAPEATGSAPELRFPVALEASALRIGDAVIRWPGGELSLPGTQLQLQIAGSSIALLSGRLRQPLLTLDTAAAEEQDTAARVVPPELALPFTLSIDEVLLEQPGWRIDNRSHELEALQLSGAWSRTQVHLEQLSVTDTRYGNALLRGDIDMRDSWSLAIDAELQVAVPEGALPGPGRRKVLLSASGALDALALQVETPDQPSLAAQVSLDALDPVLPFDAQLQANWSGAVALGDWVEVPEALGSVQLQSPWTASVEGHRGKQTFNVHGSASGFEYGLLSLRASGHHQGARIALDSLDVRDADGGNALTAAGDIVLDDTVQFALNLESPGVDLPAISDYAFGRLQGRLNVNGSVSARDWSIGVDQVDLTGRVNDLPATIRGYAGFASDFTLLRSALFATVNGAELQLQSSTQRAKDGLLRLTIADLGRWQPGARGALKIDADVAADSGRLSWQGTLENVQLDAMEAGSGTLEGFYVPQSEHGFELDMNLEQVRLGGVYLAQVQLEGSGTAASQRFTLTSAGDIATQLQVTGSIEDDGWLAQLQPASIDAARSGRWVLSQPVTLQWLTQQRQLQVAAHCWTQADTRFCPGQLALGTEAGSGSLEMDGDMAFLSVLLPAGTRLDGTMRLQLEGQWAAAADFTVRGQLLTEDVRFTQQLAEDEVAVLGWETSATDITTGAAGLNLRTEVRQQSRAVLDLDLTLPQQRDGKLAGELRLDKLDIAAAAPFIPSLSMLRGALDGELTLYGTVDQPQTRGTLQLSQAALALVGNPTELESLDLVVQVRGSAAQLTGSGLLGKGELQINGELQMQPQLSARLQLNGGKHQVLYPPSAELLLSETLTLTLSPSLLEITGQVTVHKGELAPEALPEGSVGLSSDIVEVDYAGNVLSEQLPFDTRLDVQINILDDFMITGDMIQASLGGELQVQQQPGKPLQLFGSLNVLGGELRAYQQFLQIKRGTVSFSGVPENPQLDLRAEREINGSRVTAGVRVQGRLDEMLLEVYSDPVMSQAEAMSYLVRGRGLDAGGGAGAATGDGTALALSLATGVVNRTRLVSELNDIPGISNVSFSSEGSADETAATVSGYIGERIYLSYGIGLYEPVNVLTARLYLRSRLWLEVLSRLENSVDLYYSFDLD
tara:strand:- start:51390 stop:55100 length:3711 start_codon:yes stop_codon:yes gene_type:complete